MRPGRTNSISYGIAAVKKAQLPSPEKVLFLNINGKFARLLCRLDHIGNKYIFRYTFYSSYFYHVSKTKTEDEGD